MANIEIKRIKDEMIWEKIFNEFGSLSLHQAWAWGKFQESLGHKLEFLGLYEASDIKAIALIILNRAKRGNFIFVPHGPILNKDCQDNLKVKSLVLKALNDYLLNLARRNNYDFIRIAPIFPDNFENYSVFKDLGFFKAPIYIHSETMWTLDITQSNEILLKNMRKTTRYLIKKAKKENVIISISDNPKDLDVFWELYKITADRENFKTFSKKFIYKEFEAFNQSKNVSIITGYYQDKPMASAIIFFTKSTAFYHQGASIHSKTPVPYLLQWYAIQEAKRHGCSYYSFHGVMRPGRTPRAWQGLTLFKKGFGGYQVDYLQTMDYSVSWKYYLTWIYETFLMWRRGV